MPVETKEKKGIANAIAETKTELRKVQWPKRHELINYTWIVLASVLIISLIIYGIDYGLGFIIDKTISL